MVGIYVVALFFFISGYGLEAKRNARGLSIKQLPKSIINLIIPLVIPIVIYTFLQLFIYDMTLIEFLDGLCQYKVILPYTWFVITLAILYIIFYIIATIITDTKKVIVFATIGVLSFSLVGIASGLQATYHITVSGFLAGVMYRIFEPKFICSLKGRYYMKYILWVCLFFVSCLCNFPIPIFEYPRVYLQAFVWPILVVSLLSYLPNISNQFVTFLSSISY